MEKEVDDQLGRSYEKQNIITWSQRGEKHLAQNKTDEG